MVPTMNDGAPYPFCEWAPKWNTRSNSSICILSESYHITSLMVWSYHRHHSSLLSQLPHGFSSLFPPWRRYFQGWATYMVWLKSRPGLGGWVNLFAGLDSSILIGQPHLQRRSSESTHCLCNSHVDNHPCPHTFLTRGVFSRGGGRGRSEEGEAVPKQLWHVLGYQKETPQTFRTLITTTFFAGWVTARKRDG